MLDPHILSVKTPVCSLDHIKGIGSFAESLERLKMTIL